MRSGEDGRGGKAGAMHTRTGAAHKSERCTTDGSNARREGREEGRRKKVGDGEVTEEQENEAQLG